MTEAAVPDNTVWRLTPGQQLRHRSWDGEDFVLYNNLSGDTHLLDAAAIEVLSALQRGAAGAASLASTLQLEDGADSAALLAGMLADLRKLSLVETTAC
ncbi:HPr-rel-A system PqqD family peptide chaperone [Pseudoduganella sp. LjRoot289]|uniref:HPr-rel-A system PqqD family peptide chaperone n=1 Tax=Pseudoduganella sp. LjRoot289 TaxID=3342314 RepID=UPI003ED0541D